MNAATRAKLKDAQDYCDANDKSTGFMIQFTMDSVGVSHDCVMNFLRKQADAYERNSRAKVLESGEHVSPDIQNEDDPRLTNR